MDQAKRLRQDLLSRGQLVQVDPHTLAPAIASGVYLYRKHTIIERVDRFWEARDRMTGDPKATSKSFEGVLRALGAK